MNEAIRNQLPFLSAKGLRASREIFAFRSLLRKTIQDRRNIHVLLDTKIPVEVLN